MIGLKISKERKQKVKQDEKIGQETKWLGLLRKEHQYQT
jgi:hypothetical protein